MSSQSTGYHDQGINNPNHLLNSLCSTNSGGGTKRNGRSSRSAACNNNASYDMPISSWNTPDFQQQTVPSASATKGKSNKKESHNRIERKRRDYINSQIACLGNLLPSELYRDVSEGKRNKGSVLKLSVNYITELQTTVAQTNSIQHENQMARQLIPLLVRRIETLHKALADLVEAVPHYLDVRLDDLLDEVASNGFESAGASLMAGKDEEQQQMESSFQQETVSSTTTSLDTSIDSLPGANNAVAGSRKRPRRLATVFQHAKCQLTSSNATATSNVISPIDEEYQNWARLSEYNQKQEHIISLSGTASTPGGYNSTSTPCSLSSNGSISIPGAAGSVTTTTSSHQQPASAPVMHFANNGANGECFQSVVDEFCSVNNTNCALRNGRAGGNPSNCSSPLPTSSSLLCMKLLGNNGTADSNEDIKLMYSANFLPDELTTRMQHAAGHLQPHFLVPTTTMSHSQQQDQQQQLIPLNASTPNAQQLLMSPVSSLSVPSILTSSNSLTMSSDANSSGQQQQNIVSVKPEQFDTVDAGSVSEMLNPYFSDGSQLMNPVDQLNLMQRLQQHQQRHMLDQVNGQSAANASGEGYGLVEPRVLTLHHVPMGPRTTLMHVGGLLSCSARRPISSSDSNSMLIDQSSFADEFN